MGLPISHELPAGEPPDLIIDGIIGYSLSGAPRGRAAELILLANAASAPKLALDVPSGLDAASGTRFDPSIDASATLTLALPKAGLRDAEVGELYLADISVPPELYASPALGLDVVTPFSTSDIVRIVR